MTDDDPLDLEAIAADAAALDLLAVSGDPGPDVPADLGLVLLHELRADIVAEPVELEPICVPSSSGSSVVVLATGSSNGRRTARSSAAVALVAAGVLSLGGVAAASTAAPAGSPLHGLGEAVRSVASTFADAVTPPRTAPVRPVTTPSPNGEARGATAADASRSAAAARQVSALLDAAQQLLGVGHARQAGERLDTAERRLPEVLPVHGAAALAGRLEQLRVRVDAQEAAATVPGAEPQPGKPAAPAHQPPAKPGKPAGEPAGKAAARPTPKPAASRPAQPEPAAKAKPTAKPGSGAKPGRTAPAEQGGGGKGAGPGRQPSSDASAKPRA